MTAAAENDNYDHESDEEDCEDEEEEEEASKSVSKPRAGGFSVTKANPAERISHSLTQISGTFSQIFQAFLVLMEEANMAEVRRFSPVEKEKVSKRATKFEVRLKRSTFELKQKVILRIVFI